MTIKVKTPAQERSTYVIAATFVERSWNLNRAIKIVPKIASWTLTDEDGVVINDRINVSLPSSSDVKIVLSGSDLELHGSYPERRLVVLKGSYDSTFGEDLPFRVQLEFQIENLID